MTDEPETPSVDDIHKIAMRFVDHAEAVLPFDSLQSLRSLRLALQMEKAAAVWYSDSDGREPMRSILYHSAATIALRIGDKEEAVFLATCGLNLHKDTTPPEWRAKLQNIMWQCSDAEGW